MTCVRCGKRDAVPADDKCRACRYYGRGDADPMVGVTCRIPISLLEEMRDEASRRGETLAYVMRTRLSRTALGVS